MTEGGIFIAKTAADWTYINKANGTAYGTNGAANTYDDSYALLAEDFGSDYELEATIYQDASINGAVVHEVELNGRGVQTSTTIRGIECLFNYGGGVEIYRWDPGAVDDGNRFSSILGSGNKGSNLVSGDVIRVRYQGSNVTAWINDVQTATATDSTYSTGQPWIGSFTRPGGNSAHFCLTRLKVTAL